MIEFSLRLASPGEAPATVEQHARQLGRELTGRTGLETGKPRLPAKEGAKSSTATSIGELIVTGVVSAGSIAALTQLISTYLRRHDGRSIVVRNGDTEIELSGQSQEEQQELLDRLLAGVSDDAKPPTH